VDEDPGHDPYYSLLTLPNYLRDRNTLPEALENFDYSQKAEYVAELCEILGFSEFEVWTNHDVFKFSQATAAQCWEAYLKTLKLWKP